MSAKNPTYDVSIIAPSLASLHQHVTAHNRRIEITRPGSDERAVLISAEELASLERALEILSHSEPYRQMASRIAAVAAATTGDYAS